jgi:hypothetical protein
MKNKYVEARRFEDIGVEERSLYMRAAVNKMERTVSSKDSSVSNVVEIAEQLFYDDDFSILVE